MKAKKIFAIVLCTSMIISAGGVSALADITKTDFAIYERNSSTSNASISNTDEIDEEDAAWELDTELEDTSSLSRKTQIQKASPSNVIEVSTEEALKNAVRQDGKIVILEDISLSGKIIIDSANITITSNGAGLYCNDNYQDENMLTIAGYANVVLENIDIDATQLGDVQNLDGEYFAIGVYGEGNLVIEEGTSIISSPAESNSNIYHKGGIFIGYTGEMNGGFISGFPKQGVLVGRKGEFHFNEGEICDIRNTEDPEQGGGGIGILGKAALNGGLISNCYIGIFNNNHLTINEGEISNNQFGVINNNRDNLSGELFEPKATMNGGSIRDNTWRAIINRDRGEFIIPEGSTAWIEGKSDGLRTRSVKQNEATYVIENKTNAQLVIGGGTIVSKADNEIAILNDDTGKLSMSGGQISVSGNQSTAVRNKNMAEGQVKLAGGLIEVTGNGSQALDDQGKIEITKDLNINEGGTDKYYITVSRNEGGTVSPSSQIAAKDQEVAFTFSPNAGYRVSAVVVDGVSKGAITSYQLKVLMAHTIEVTFEKKSSGGSGGGGGGSSSGTSGRESVVQQTIPETPGTWLHNQHGWSFSKPDGTNYLNEWIYVGGHWYRIGAEGYMIQGWGMIDGAWYYLVPVSGEMKTGWIQVGGQWYFLSSDGKMLANTTTPDGYKVGEDGSWIK